MFSAELLWGSHCIYGAIVALALRLAPWGRLAESRQHIFLACSIALMVLWSIRTPAADGVSYHLLGLTTVTLMFGWSLAIIAAGIAQLGTTLSGAGDWAAFSLNALLVAVVPVTLTQSILVVVRAFLPRHFFVYVFVNAFFAAAFTALISGLAMFAAIAVAADQGSAARFSEIVLPFLPLMLFPEAFLNGMLVTVLVGLRPDWVYSFDDRQYLHGK